jgi:hypothetical protein
MARALPHNLNTMMHREVASGGSPAWVAFRLVGVEQDEPFRGRSASSSQMFELANGHFNSRQGVASAYSQVRNKNMNRQLCRADHVLKQTHVAGLGLPFASHEDRAPKWNGRTPLAHPI